MRVTVLEDQLLTREGLVRTLTEGGVEVVAAVGDVPALFRSVALDHPDAVTLDVRVPPTRTDEGLRAAGTIRSEYPSCGILLLSHWAEPEFIEPLLASHATGIGYLLKDRVLDPATLLDALRRIGAGDLVIDPGIVADLLAERGRGPRLPGLSPREVEVLAAVAEGLTNAGIARRLRISERTVEVHVQHVFEKLSIDDDPHSNRRVRAALVYLESGR